MKRYETCKVCGESWNISKRAKIDGRGYICPVCALKVKKGKTKNV